MFPFPFIDVVIAGAALMCVSLLGGEERQNKKMSAVCCKLNLLKPTSLLRNWSVIVFKIIFVCLKEILLFCIRATSKNLVDSLEKSYAPPFITFPRQFLLFFSLELLGWWQHSLIVNGKV